MDIGKKIIELRKTRKLSQRDLAEKANIACSMLSFYETGKNIPTQKALNKIIEALNLTDGEKHDLQNCLTPNGYDAFMKTVSDCDELIKAIFNSPVSFYAFMVALAKNQKVEDFDLFKIIDNSDYTEKEKNLLKQLYQRFIVLNIYDKNNVSVTNSEDSHYFMNEFLTENLATSLKQLEEALKAIENRK